MCNTLTQPLPNWAGRAANIAHKPQPPDKPKLLPMSDVRSLAAYCIKCAGGYDDPTKALRNCPTCKSELIVAGENKPAATSSSFGNLSKTTIAWQQRAEAIGANGEAPKTPEDQAKEDKIATLKAQIVTLESFKVGDFTEQIKIFQKEIKELEKTLVSPDVQLLKDQSAIHHSLAELEQKHANIKQQLEDQIAKEVEKQGDAEAEGKQVIKNIEEDYRSKLESAKRINAITEARAVETRATMQKKLGDHIKEAKEQIAAQKAKSAPVLQKVATNAAADSGASGALLAIAPGQIVHSNHLSAQTFLDAFAHLPGMAALQPEMLQAFAQVCIQVVGSQAMEVPAHPAPPPTLQVAPAAAPVQRQVVATTAVEEVKEQEGADASQQTAPPESQMEDQVLTDGACSEEEMMNANSGLPPVSKKKPMTRAARKQRAAGKNGLGVAQKIGSK